MIPSRSRLSDGRLLLPIVLLIVTTLYFVDAVQMAPPMRDGNMTVSFFPMAIAIMMYMAIASVLWHIARIPPETTDPNSSDKDERRLGPLWITLLTGAYIFAFSAFGYFISTFLYVFILTILFGERAKGLLFKLIASLVITAGGYLLFEVVFQVRLPTLWRI